MDHLFLHCRPGFEKECAAEITDVAANLGIYGYSKTKPHSAFVVFVTQQPEGASAIIKGANFQQLIFVRQWFAGGSCVDQLDVSDRLSPLMTRVQEMPEVAEISIETVDTNDGKELSGLCKKFTRPFEAALKKQHRINKHSGYRLHLVFLSGTAAYVGISPRDNSARWVMGIPRLKVPRQAPSRATLKLEEAWHHFVPADEWDERLTGGKAVDLGAAPGGWTWQLVNRGMFVDAIDNGPMDEGLMDSGQVTHHRSDGFAYEPKKPVRWLVCDIADKPSRVASMIARWVGQRWCQEAVFNLKLPMKQRYAEVQKCQQKIEQALAEREIRIELSFKQLYHDREEVTGHIRRME